jgi:hypothetical protein
MISFACLIAHTFYTFRCFCYGVGNVEWLTVWEEQGGGGGGRMKKMSHNTEWCTQLSSLAPTLTLHVQKYLAMGHAAIT